MANFGLIETIKVVGGQPLFKNLHIERLYQGLQLLDIPVTVRQLEDRLMRSLQSECIDNGLQNARLRLEVWKNNTSEINMRTHRSFVAQEGLIWNATAQPLTHTEYHLNQTPLKLTLYDKQYKNIDIFSNLKQTERAIYHNAQDFALQTGFQEALVLNTQKNLADASIYNVFIVKNRQIYTPPLADAPVNGVLRRWLLGNLKRHKIIEQSISVQDIYDADEIFLTNAIRGIQQATQLKNKPLDNAVTKAVFEEFYERIRAN
jgi:branched-chain amino acid aminotransferase